MTVHFIGAHQKFGKSLRSQREHDGQADGAPDREAAAHPIPETEAVFRRQAHDVGGFGIGGHHHHMAAAVGPHNTVVKKPLIDGCCIHLRFAGRKAL